MFASSLKLLLRLHVYEKNQRAVKFYLREGFEISSEDFEETTGEKEYLMVFKR